MTYVLAYDGLREIVQNMLWVDRYRDAGLAQAFGAVF